MWLHFDIWICTINIRVSIRVHGLHLSKASMGKPWLSSCPAQQPKPLKPPCFEINPLWSGLQVTLSFQVLSGPRDATCDATWIGPLLHCVARNTCQHVNLHSHFAAWLGAWHSWGFWIPNGGSDFQSRSCNVSFLHMFEGLRHGLCDGQDVRMLILWCPCCPCALGQKIRLGLSLRDAAQEQEGAEWVVRAVNCLIHRHLPNWCRHICCNVALGKHIGLLWNPVQLGEQVDAHGWVLRAFPNSDFWPRQRVFVTTVEKLQSFVS